eukprot:7929041-Pyramimonas_sp.AAC.1
MYLEDYQTAHGDPALKGHAIVPHPDNGRKIVVIPSGKLCKIRKVNSVISDVNKVVADRDDADMSKTDLNDIQAGLFKSFGHTKATGWTLDQLMGSSSSQSPGPAPSQPQTPVPRGTEHRTPIKAAGAESASEGLGF